MSNEHHPRQHVAARCTCGSSPHSIHCLSVAATQPHAMVNDAGEVFYPDNDEDAAYFAQHHGAHLLMDD